MKITLKSLMAFSVMMVGLGLGTQASAQTDYVATIASTDVLVTSTGDNDAVIRIGATVTNTGSQNGSGASRLLLTAESASDVSLTPLLLSGRTHAVSKILVVPAGQIDCDCEDDHLVCTVDLTATADIFDQITETNEGNNTDSLTIAVGSQILTCD